MIRLLLDAAAWRGVPIVLPSATRFVAIASMPGQYPAILRETSSMGALIADAWRNGFATMRRNPSLYTLAFIVFMLLGWAIALVSPTGKFHPGVGAAPASLLLGLLASLASGLVQSVVNVPCAVAAHRYVLIGPGGDRHLLANLPRLARFYLAGLVIGLLAVVPGGIAVFGAMDIRRLGAGLGGVLVLVALALLVPVIIVSLRFVLVFPAVATDRENVWRASWEATRGHWWMIFGTTLFCLLPLWLVVVLLSAIATALPGAAGPVLGAFFSAVLSIGAASIGASLLSGFYRRYTLTPEHSAAAIWTS